MEALERHLVGHPDEPDAVRAPVQDGRITHGPEGEERRANRVGVARPARLRTVPEEPVKPVAVAHEGGGSREGALRRPRHEVGAGRIEPVDRSAAPVRSGAAEIGEEGLERRIRRCVVLAGESDNGVAVRARRLHRRGAVVQLPAGRENRPERAVRMKEGTPLEVAEPGIGTERHPVETLEVGLPPDPLPGHLSRSDPCGDPVPALKRIRVCGEEGGHPPRRLAGTRGIREHLEGLGHRSRVVSLPGHVAEPQVVGLPLVVPPVGEKEEAEPGGGGLCDRGQVGPEDGADAEPDLRELGAAHLADGVTGRHMADLMAEDPREFGLGAEVGEDPPGHVDEPAREREGVDDGVVDDPEGPREIGTLGAERHRLAEPLDVGLPFVVGVEAERGDDLRIRLPPDLDLPVLADKNELTFARRRVDRAPREQSCKKGEEEETGGDLGAKPSPKAGCGHLARKGLGVWGPGR